MYILDEDPIQSARCLIKPLVLLYLQCLEYSFSYCNGIIVEENSRVYLVPRLSYSLDNYIWFSKFYEELVSMRLKYDLGEYSSRQYFNKELLYKPSITFESTGLLLPTTFESPRSNYKKTCYKRYIRGLTSPIDINRIIYILQSYNASMFACGIPAWYSSVTSKVLEKYSKKDRKNVKIISNGDEYQYFISTISDKWVEVENVPAEIKYVIDAILYS